MRALLNQSNLIKLLIVWFPIGFLMIRHAVHFSLYAIFLLFIYDLIKNTASISFNRKSIIIATSLGAILIATATQQTISSSFNSNAFDGPSRLLIAGICMLYLAQKNIAYKKLLEIAIPVALILLCIYLGINKTNYWGPRWANSFVDPNSLGSQSTILSMLCILLINQSTHPYLNLLKLVGAICGFYISIKAESRGGWMVIPVMTFSWLIIQITQPDKPNKNHSFRIVTSLLALIISVATIATFVDSVNARLVHTSFEISTWFKDPTIYTSAGARMSMWVVSLELISENLWGYGEITIKELLSNHPLYTGIHHHGATDMIAAGPHSDLLSKGLSLGIPGILAYSLTILAPAILFASKIKNSSIETRDAASMGLVYLTGVFVAGLFNETLSLKYLCSFYGLMIACLAAQVLYQPNANASDKTT